MSSNRAGPSSAGCRASEWLLRNGDAMSAQVVVVPFDPHWADSFARAAQEVLGAMSPALTVLHHIGSTSVPGIYAKPIIDMLAVVSDLAALDQRARQMKSLGYEPMGEFGIPGRRYFRRDDSKGDRTHQIHAFAVGSPHVNRHLAFRDFLRAHPSQAGQYSELKRRLAAAHPNDIEAYMDGKDGFIKGIEATALAWVATRHPEWRYDAPLCAARQSLLATGAHGVV